MIAWLYVGFIALILVFLAIDLGVFNRQAHAISIKESLVWTAVWIALSLLFNLGVYFMYRHEWLGLGVGRGPALPAHQAALMYFTGYLVEKSLSLDNIFVIALIFTYFRVPAMYQHRVLYYGILGAILMRGAMIAAGAALIHRFDWVIYVFGGLLLLTAVRMMFTGQEQLEPEKNPLIRLARKLFPVSPGLAGEHFFTRIEGKVAVTPLFLVLLLVESSDVLFAVDSIPAIFAITTDTFLVFTSNIFAILGLRSLYFALAGMMDKFRYLKAGLVILLAFIGVKMLVSRHFHIPTLVSLGVIALIIVAAVLASVYASHREAVRAGAGPVPRPPERSGS